MAIKKYLSLDRLTEYDALIKTEIDEKIDNKISSKADSTHTHDGVYDAKGSASAVQSNLNVVSDTLSSHIENSDIHVTTTNKSNWNSAYTHSTSTHARVDATKVADSTTNGNILINDAETNVYSHPNSGVTAGTYKSVTVNAQGHITSGSNPTTLAGYGITDAETKNDANKKLTEAKTYADNAAAAVKSDLLNGAGGAYDTLKELGDLIDDNQDAISALETVAAGKADKSHTHAIADVSGLQSALDGKAASSHGTHVSYSTTAPVMDGTASVGTASTVARSDHKHPTDTSRASKTEFDTHVSDTTKHITSTERTNWGTAYTHSQSAHAPSNAQANQNAFSNVKVGTTTIAADTTTDTLEFIGSNVTITPDATNDKVTFAVADGSTSAKGVVQLTNSTSSTSTTTAATPSSVKSAYDLANTAKTNAATAQTKADSAYSLAESKADSLSDLGVTATSAELNYMDGVTSSVQTQLNGKASSSHNHGTDYVSTSSQTLTDIQKSNARSNISAAEKDHTHSIYALKTNPVLYSSISMGRVSGSTVGNASTAIGSSVTSSGTQSFASGSNATASGSCAHALGNGVTASANYSFATGVNTTASEYYSFAEGNATTASGEASHAAGSNTIAAGKNQYVHGKYNVEDSDDKYAHIVGNGTSSARSNAYTLDWNGNAQFAGDVYVDGGSTKLAKTTEIPIVETGTWTAAINLGTITTQKCTYMKVENMVTISFFIQGTGSTISSNTFLCITGVPYTPSSDALWYGGGGHMQGLKINSGSYFTGMIMQPDGKIYLRTSDDTQSATTGYYACINNGGATFYISGTITYPIAE